MIAKTFKGGRTSQGARKTIDYLLNDRVQKGSARLFKGDKVLTQKIINLASKKQKWSWSSGVLSFEESIKDDKKLDSIIKDFETTFFCGMNKNQYNILWVLHEDKGRTELHYIAPRLELSTGLSFNPYFVGRDFAKKDLFQDYINLKHNLSSHKDNLQLTTSKKTNWKDLYSKKDIRSSIDNELLELIKNGFISSRDEVIEQIKEWGFGINRQGKDYITIVDNNNKKHRLKGGIYGRDFQNWTELEEKFREKRTTSSNGNEREFKKVRESLSEIIGKQSEFNRGKYSKSKRNIFQKDERIEYEKTEYKRKLNLKTVGEMEKNISNFYPNSPSGWDNNRSILNPLFLSKSKNKNRKDIIKSKSRKDIDRRKEYIQGGIWGERDKRNSRNDRVGENTEDTKRTQHQDRQIIKGQINDRIGIEIIERIRSSREKSVGVQQDFIQTFGTDRKPKRETYRAIEQSTRGRQFERELGRSFREIVKNYRNRFSESIKEFINIVSENREKRFKKMIKKSLKETLKKYDGYNHSAIKKLFCPKLQDVIDSKIDDIITNLEGNTDKYLITDNMAFDKKNKKMYNSLSYLNKYYDDDVVVDKYKKGTGVDLKSLNIDYIRDVFYKVVKNKSVTNFYSLSQAMNNEISKDNVYHFFNVNDQHKITINDLDKNSHFVNIETFGVTINELKNQYEINKNKSPANSNSPTMNI